MLTSHIDDLRDALRQVQARHPFVIDAMVVLPDHLHAVWTLPRDDADYPMRWRLLKSWFSRHVPAGEPGGARVLPGLRWLTESSRSYP